MRAQLNRSNSYINPDLQVRLVKFSRSTLSFRDTPIVAGLGRVVVVTDAFTAKYHVHKNYISLCLDPLSSFTS